MTAARCGRARRERIAAALAVAMLAAGCSVGPREAPVGSAPDTSRLPGVSDRTGTPAACSPDLQSCANGETCCSGLVCAPHGRFGMLCRRPAVGG